MTRCYFAGMLAVVLFPVSHNSGRSGYRSRYSVQLYVYVRHDLVYILVSARSPFLPHYSCLVRLQNVIPFDPETFGSG